MDLSIISSNSVNSDNSDNSDNSNISDNCNNLVETVYNNQNNELNQSVLSSKSQQSNNSHISNNSYSSSKTIRGIEECCICFHPLIQEVAHLECNHKFHFNCLSKWQQKKRTQNIICPICQQNSIIKNITSASDLENITYILNETNQQKNKRLMENNRYTKFPGIDAMDHSIICCNIL